MVEKEIKQINAALAKSQVHSLLENGIIFIEKTHYYKYQYAERPVLNKLLTGLHEKYMQSGEQNFEISHPDLEELCDIRQRTLRGHVATLWPVFLKIRSAKVRGKPRFFKRYSLTETGLLLMKEIQRLKVEAMKNKKNGDEQ